MTARLILALCLIALATGGGAAATDARISGRFCGPIWSGGVNSAGVTVLHVEPDGAISGAYEFHEPNGDVVEGALQSDGAVEGHRIRLRWRDKYGEGGLILSFTSRFNAYFGRWGFGDMTPQYRYDGERCDLHQS